MAKDVSLMLRSGYSVEAIEEDLTARRFLGPCNALEEKQLTPAGVSGVLIADLKGARYALPAAEISGAQKEMKAKARQRAAVAEEAKKAEKAYREQARSRAEASVPVVAGNIIASAAKGVTSRNGIFRASRVRNCFREQ